MKKQLLLVALLYSQLFAAQILVNLDLSDKKISEQNLEIPQINYNKSISEVHDIWWNVNQFLRSVGADKNDHYAYNNIVKELLNLKITSVDFDYKTLTENSIEYKINYNITYNYDNYEYHTKKLINSLSKLAKPQIKSLSESEFISFLNNQKTQDKQFLKDEDLSLIYVFLKNKDNYDMYIYTILGKKTLGLNDGFYKNMALAPDYADYISMGAFLGLKEYSINEPSYQYQEDYLPPNSEYFLNNYAILAGSFSKVFGNLTNNIEENNNIVIFPYFLEVNKKQFSTYKALEDMKSIKGFVNKTLEFSNEYNKNFFSEGGDELDIKLSIVPIIDYKLRDIEDEQEVYE